MIDLEKLDEAVYRFGSVQFTVHDDEFSLEADTRRLANVAPILIAECRQLRGERERLRKALEEAAQSLETINNQGGRPDSGIDDVFSIRGYANSRATVARSVLAATEGSDGKEKP